MPVSRVTDAVIEGAKVKSGFKLLTVNKTVGANITLLANEPPVQVLTITGAHRDVTLPAFSAANEGLTFIVCNIAASALNAVVKSASNTILTVGQGKTGIFVCDGGEWRGLLGA
jgi:intracellular sulfur oxidation DsrE/DsrF family protein